MKYSVKIECDNQKSVMNFQSELDSSILVELFKKVVKSNYRVSITSVPFWNKRAKRTLETVLLWAKDVRFYKEVEKTDLHFDHTREPLFDMLFPATIYLDKQWHSDWGGTFFELKLFDDENTHYVGIDFDKCREEFEKHKLDLYKSKTHNVWYSHYNIELFNEGKNKLCVEKNITVTRKETRIVKVEI